MSPFWYRAAKKQNRRVWAATGVREPKVACAYVEPWFVQLHACIWCWYRAGRRVYLPHKRKEGDDNWRDAERHGTGKLTGAQSSDVSEQGGTVLG